MLFLLYGEAIRTRIEKLNTSDTVTTQTVRPVDTNIKLQNKTVFSETELKSMDTAQLQKIVTQLAPQYRESLKSVGLNSNIVDAQVDAMVSSQDVTELMKSADVMQKELGLEGNVQITADGKRLLFYCGIKGRDI